MERVRQIARSGTTLVLITHHVEEIIPEIGRVIFIAKGRIVGDGPKAEMMTSARLSSVFDGPMTVDQSDGYYFARGIAP